MQRKSRVKAIDILGLDKPSFTSLSSNQSKGHSHGEDDECPVCKNKMTVVKIGYEDVFFCPDHRVSFPMRS